MSTHSSQQPTVGVLAMAYGTPASLEDVEAYYTHVRHGHRPSPELLAELQGRYRAIGGTSPLLEHTRTQIAGIQAALDRLASGRFIVEMGMKHASPFIEDGVRELLKRNVQQIVGLVLAPHYSIMSVGEYTQRARAACPPEVALTVIKQWYLAPGYLNFLTETVNKTLSDLLASNNLSPEEVVVLFTAHSLPTRILEMGDTYPEQLRETAEVVAARANLNLKHQCWLIAWQSAGRTKDPWIGPDLLTVIADLIKQGVKGVVVCPAGFVSEHLEILYDLDIETRQFAERSGIAFARTALPHNDPGVFASLAELIVSG
ncbi:MAG TPA: ferrochelatase [Ktedonobacteraceae bacterium]|nr:ferrochelatase [Ktedonobacteraceae bacterium]